MSIDSTGLNNSNKLTGMSIVIEITNEHPLILLSNMLDWESLAEMVLPDLQATTKKGNWKSGRALRLRIHLGAYLLQQLFNKTDRETEYAIKDNAAYQLFCGRTVVKKWHCPDHTKIEKFRSRLSPKTQQQLANAIATHAVKLRFANPADIDMDSTIQEANMKYPRDSSLLCKLGAMGKKIAEYMNKKVSDFKHKPMEVNLKKIKSVARGYFFLKEKATIEEKSKKLSALVDCVETEIKLVLSNARCMVPSFVEELPWNIKKTFKVFVESAKKYLSDVKDFIKTGHMVPNKLLSFHLNNVKCLSKNKDGKKYYFGRTFQLARIAGNFLFVEKCTDLVMSDKSAVNKLLTTHKEIFNGANIKSLTTDKGYYSGENEKAAIAHNIDEICIQRPISVKKKPKKSLSKSREVELIDRRAGIEPLIGHAKHGGQLGRSRMKTDKTIESSGYTSILSFNLRQLIRNKFMKIKKFANENQLDPIGS